MECSPELCRFEFDKVIIDKETDSFSLFFFRMNSNYVRSFIDFHLCSERF